MIKNKSIPNEKIILKKRPLITNGVISERIMISIEKFLNLNSKLAAIILLTIKNWIIVLIKNSDVKTTAAPFIPNCFIANHIASK